MVELTSDALETVLQKKTLLSIIPVQNTLILAFFVVGA